MMGFTVPEIDKILAKYAHKSYNKYVKDYKNFLTETLGIKSEEEFEKYQQQIHDSAMKKVEKEAEQVFQGLEYKLNTVGSSRGDYPKFGVL